MKNNKITLVLNKFYIYAINIICIISIFTYLRGCSHLKENKRMRKEINGLYQKIDSIDNNIYYKDQLDKRLKIENLKSEKSTLHNMNEIVLKNIRPAQRINQIDKEIERLEKSME